MFDVSLIFDGTKQFARHIQLSIRIDYELELITNNPRSATLDTVMVVFV